VSPSRAITILATIVATSVATFAIAPPAPAGAQDRPRFRLAFQAPDECSDARAFRDRVVARLGYDPFDDAAESAAELTIDRDETRYVAEARLSGRTRTLGPTTSCGELLTVLATTLSIAIDPLAPEPPPVAREVGRQPEQPAAVSSSTSSTSTSSTTTTTTTELELSTPEADGLDGPSFGAEAHAGVSVGAAPQPMLEIDVGATIGAGDWSGRVGARVRHALLDIAVRDESIGLGLYTGHAAGCFEPLLIVVCLEVELGGYVGDARQRRSTQTEWFLGIGARGGLRLEVAAGVALDAMLAVTATPTPLRIWLDGALAAEMLPVAGSLVIGAHVSPSSW
jgi:hypothetical protein